MISALVHHRRRLFVWGTRAALCPPERLLHGSPSSTFLLQPPCQRRASGTVPPGRPATSFGGIGISARPASFPATVHRRGKRADSTPCRGIDHGPGKIEQRRRLGKWTTTRGRSRRGHCPASPWP